MIAVVLCTDSDKGLLPVNERTPDSMLKIAGQTPAQTAVKKISEAGVDKIYAVGDYLSERVRAYIESAFPNGQSPEFAVLDGDLSARLAELSGGEDILAVNAAGIFDFSFRGLVRFFEDHSCTAAVACVKPDDGAGCRRCGKINCDGVSAVGFYPEDQGLPDAYDGVFAEAAVFSSELIERIASSKYRSLSEIISAQISEGENVCVYFAAGRFSGLHSPADLVETALERLLQGQVSHTAKELQKGIYSEDDISLSGITIAAPAYIGKNVTLGKGCVIENSIIEDNAVIGARAELRGCCIGEAAEIGAGVCAEKAVVCPSAQVCAAARLGEYSVVGEKAVLGSGAQLMPKVRVFAEKRAEPGDIVSTDVTSSGGGAVTLDDDCCCGFSSGVSLPCECARFAMAVGTALPEGAIAVCGCCGGEGAKAMLSAFESGLSSAGIKVLSVGEANGQEIMFLVNRLGAELGCFINAEFSERIGLMRRGGLPLEGSLQSGIERAAALNRFRTLPFDSYGERFDLSDAKSLYRVFLSQLLPAVFHGLNADVRCSSMSMARLADSIIRPKNDTEGERVIFHLSNDGRTCTAYTDETGYVTGERLVLLAVKAAFEKDIPVSLPYTFPMAADKLAEQLGGKLYRYFHAPLDGSDSAARQVAERPDNFFVRDGMALLCMICAYLCEKRMTLSEAMSDVPDFYSAQRFAVCDAPASQIYRRLGCRREGGSDGVVVQNETSRAMVRPLKRRRGLIIFAESVKAETASGLCDEIIKTLKKEK